MGKTRKIDVCWPTDQQELLLKAALLTGEESIHSWEKWIASVDIDSIDWGSQRLLPLLYKNLQSQGVSHKEFDKFKGVYRQAWYRNQMVLYDMAEVIGKLHQAGIRTLLLKGAAMIIIYYKDPGLRPMGDFDLLIPSRDLIQVINFINENEVMQPLFGADQLSDYHISNTKHYQYLSHAGVKVELHHHILFETNDPDADQDFWAGAMPIKIGDVPTLALHPADQLLHTCIHGLPWNITPPLRWVADSFWILQNTPMMDWDRLFHQAKKFNVLFSIREALLYLHHLVSAPIPASVLEHLHNLKVSSPDRMEFNQYNNSPQAPEITSFPRLIVILWHMHTFNSPSNLSVLSRLWRFPRFLQNYWNLGNMAELPLAVIKKSAQVLGRWWKKLYQ